MTKLIIAGGRDFRDYCLLERSVFDFVKEFGGIDEIVSGCQVTTDKKTGEKYGADYLGEQFAKKFGIHVERFPPDWAHLGKRAGYERNKKMAEYATHCLAFWDGKSRGTGMMIGLAGKHNLKTKVVRYDSKSSPV